MSAKLRIKTKGIEIEWEGEIEFLKSEVPDLIASLLDAIGSGLEQDDEIIPDSRAEPTGSGTNGTATHPFTTASAAAKLKVKSGTELFKAALAKLQISEGVEPASRGQILDEMKSAPRFYKPSMRGNLTKMIDSLIEQGEINEPSTGHFVLSHPTYEKIARNLNS